MTRPLSLALLYVIGILTACTDTKPTIAGLWAVTQVKMGEDEVTPMARWMRFDQAGTQQSGNGWYQHSVGTWSLDDQTGKLTIINTNGYQDLAPPFDVTLQGDRMLWKRIEDDLPVEVTLERVQEIPTAPTDQLLGVWDLTQATKGDQDILASLDPEQKRYLFLRWDKQFRMHNTPEGRSLGTYHTHGHRSMLTFYFGGDDCQTEQWTYEVTPETLTLESITLDTIVRKQYRRIDYFPE